MSFSKMNIRSAFVLAPLLLACGALPASAQNNTAFPFLNSQENRDNPAAALGNYLRMLADNPNNVTALIGAGRTALDIGDAVAALGFFVRANELSPRNGMVNAGLGSALVRLERPLEAMARFREAARLGMPARSFAADRGLAFDLLGQPELAQADYRQALARERSAETTKRLALSLAISGDRTGALQVLDPLLRSQDRSAWRTRAFIIGLTTEDVREAVEAAAVVLRRRELEILTPYLGRLSTLSNAGKAQAVHFGNFPEQGDGPRYALADFPEFANAGTPGEGLVPSGEALGRPSAAEQRRIERRTARQRQRRESDERRRTVSESLTRRRPGATSRVETARVEATPPPAPSPPPPPPPPVPTAAPAPQVPVEDRAAPGFTDLVGPPTPGEATPAEPSQVRSSRFSLDDLATDLRNRAQTETTNPIATAPAESLLPPGLAAPEPSTPPHAVDVRTPSPAVVPLPAAEPPTQQEAVAVTTSEPARNWVQVATGPNPDGMRFTYRRYARANAVFAGLEGWFTPLGQTNRVLVGPFDNGAAAQSFVNSLSEAGIDSLRWRSPQGQPIERLYPEGRSPQPTADARAADAPRAEPQAPTHPSRNWAQIAIGQQVSALRFTYRQFSRRAPEAFGGQAGWFTSWNNTNRLLVGPFPSRAAAQAFLNAVQDEGDIAGHTFRSAAGQNVRRLNTR